MLIDDGSGSGRSVAVNKDNRLATAAISSSIEHHINHAHGLAFNASFIQAPTANDDCILYIQNDSDTDMVVEGFYLATSAACEIYLQKNNIGTRNGATDITAQNVNLGSGKEAEVTIEKGADLDGGAATLTSGGEIARGVFHAALSTNWFNFEQDLIVPKNKTFTMWCDTAGVTVTGMVPFNFHPDDLG